jgi:uncharacterized membrane protein (UPF0127 family)
MNPIRVQLTAADHVIDARVARTPEQRALGLMHRTELDPNEGMLFVCDEHAVQRFWMKDTPVPLSIAFLDDDGTILHVDDLDPHSLEGCSSRQPVRYVLEMPQGWFRERGIGPGDRVAGPAFIGAAAGQPAEAD